ncbi:MAG: hypothetical protein WCV90_08000 [Candidatus Woesearchaeota archaeon]|jgi:hypothetical protein
MINPLDFYLINDHYTHRLDLAQSIIEMMSIKGKFEARTFTLAESVLNTPTYGSELIPPEAIIYVHGNHVGSNCNFDRSLELAKQRPDLRLVIGIDPIANQGRFTSQETYLKYRELPDINTVLTDLEEGDITLQNFTRIALVLADPSDVLRIPSDNVDFPETPAAMQRYLSAHYQARNPR